MWKPDVRKLLGLVWLLTLTFSATPAEAGETKGACVVVGEAKVVDKDDVRYGVRVMGGKGTFVFRDFVVLCGWTAKGAPDVQVLSIGASGHYNNKVCGTGKAWGIVTDVTGPVKYQNILVNKKFAIHFTASTGVFFWHAWAKPASPVDIKDQFLSNVSGGVGNKTTPDKDWQAAGGVSLYAPIQKNPPQQPNTPPGNCTKAFGVVAGVTIDA